MAVALRRLVVALAGGLLAWGGLAAGAAVPAATAPPAAPIAGACTDGAGVTVVVDFGRLGGGVQVRCAPAPVKSGFEALTRAGFAITSVSGQAFLCRIDGRPADDPCNRIPSAASYWGYWHAERGEDWSYSSSGASRRPPAGSVEGWSFGDGDAPSAAPPRPLTPPTTARPAPPTTAPPPPPPVTAPGTPTTLAGSDTTAPSTTASPSTTTTAPVGPVDRGPDDDGDLLAVGGPPAGEDPDAGSGSPASVAAAVVLVGGVGVAGFRTVRRRARDAEASG